MTGAPHVPVMVEEVLDLLAPQPGQLMVDGTVGYAGHSIRLGEAISPDGTLVAIDQDPAALAAAGEQLKNLDCRVLLIHGNFRRLSLLLDECGISLVDGILLDLGVSSAQLDLAERGFSFRSDTPLDMRMDPTQGVPIAELLDRLNVRELASVLHEYGDERWSVRIAQRIVEARSQGGVRTTGQLADVVKGAIPKSAWPRDIHPATRTFQALRVLANDEINALSEALDAGVNRLQPGGRIAVISFQSGEDRVVKQAFRRLSGRCQCPPGLPLCVCGAQAVVKIITRKPVTPAEAELRSNPRSRSARLRVAERLAV